MHVCVPRLEGPVTKGDTAPPAAKLDEVFDMVGSTRELKAKAYADSVVKEVAAQYTSQISNTNNDMGSKDDMIEQLQLQLKKCKTNMCSPQLLILLKTLRYLV